MTIRSFFSEPSDPVEEALLSPSGFLCPSPGTGDLTPPLAFTVRGKAAGGAWGLSRSHALGAQEESMWRMVSL